MYMVYAIAVAAWIHFRLEETLHPEYRLPMRMSAFAHGFIEVIKNRTTAGYMVAMGLMFGCLIGYLNSSRQIFQEHFAVGEQFAFYFGGLALTLGVASLLNSRFVAKFGMRFICHRAMATIVISSLVFLALNFVLTPMPIAVFVVYMAIVFFSFGLMFGNLNAIAMEPMGHIAGMASAITGSVSSIISLTLGTLIGQMYNNTLIPVSCGFFILSTLALCLMLLVDGKKTA
jgi:DHA1 family bicyclomycin/chloramphenicol resistance-like MFS transporter